MAKITETRLSASENDRFTKSHVGFITASTLEIPSGTVFFLQFCQRKSLPRRDATDARDKPTLRMIFRILLNLYVNYRIVLKHDLAVPDYSREPKSPRHSEGKPTLAEFP